MGEFSESLAGLKSAGTHCKLTLYLKSYKNLKSYRTQLS